MKTPPLLLVFVTVYFLSLPASYAQTLGWQWAVAGDSVNSNEVTESVIDVHGNVYASMEATGVSNSFGPVTVYNYTGNQQLVLTKSDSSGNFLWGIGTEYADAWPLGTAIDGAANVYVFGNYSNDSCLIGSIILTNPMLYSMNFLAKISPSGSVIWAKNIYAAGSAATAYGGTGAGIDADAAGNVYMTAAFYTPSTTIGSFTLLNADTSGIAPDIFVAKFDSSGNALWANRYGSPDADMPYTIAVNDTGNIFVTGTYAGDIPIGTTTLAGTNNFLAKFNNNGSPLWAVNINSPLFVNGIDVDVFGAVYITGYSLATTILGTDTLPEPGLANFFVAKYSAAGNVLWARSGIDTGGDDQGYDVASDYCGNIWITGGGSWETASTVNFGGHQLPIPYSSQQEAMFIVSYDSAGNYLSGMGLNGGGDDNSYIMTDNKGNFYLAGDNATPGFTISADTFYLDSLFPTENLFIARYKYDTVACGLCRAGAPVPNFTRSGADTVSFTYTGTSLYDSLRWTFGDGATSAATNPVHTYTTAGTYTACVDVYSPCANDGTFAQYCDTVHISIATDTLTGVSNISNYSMVSIYPNPAVIQLTVQSTGQTISRIVVTDLLGQIVFSRSYCDTHVQIDVSHLPSGGYLIKVNGSTVKEFVKE